MPFASASFTCYRVACTVHISAFAIMPVVTALLLTGCREPSTSDDRTPEPDRAERARATHEAGLRQLCSSHDLPYPPPVLFIRAFKHEAYLEVWGGKVDSDLNLLFTFPLTANSGVLGPKRREADRQIPEGCYVVDRFNPKSKFHLSMGLNYPNKSDRVFADPTSPGSDIFIHGSDASIGCLAIGDEAIEKLYVLSAAHRDQRNTPIPVHIFPARFDSSEWPKIELSAGPDQRLAGFWGELRKIFDAFEGTRRIPNVEVEPGGSYVLLP
jgi:murein L,D-transpeptidase YafK